MPVLGREASTTNTKPTAPPRSRPDLDSRTFEQPPGSQTAAAPTTRHLALRLPHHCSACTSGSPLPSDPATGFIHHAPSRPPWPKSSGPGPSSARPSWTFSLRGAIRSVGHAPLHCIAPPTPTNNPSIAPHHPASRPSPPAPRAGDGDERRTPRCRLFSLCFILLTPLDPKCPPPRSSLTMTPPCSSPMRA